MSDDRFLEAMARVLHLCREVDDRMRDFQIDKEKFVAQGDYRDMLLMPVVRIGESVFSKNEVADHASEMFPRIPWNEIRGFRNRIVHAYDRADLETCWAIVSGDIAELKTELEGSPDVLRQFHYDYESVPGDALSDVISISDAVNRSRMFAQQHKGSRSDQER